MSEFDRLWGTARNEVFRLQLLNIYADDTRSKDFKDFIEGKPVHYTSNEEAIAWSNEIAKKRADGVSYINLHVVDLPLSDGIRFGIGYLRFHAKNGMQSRFVERKDVTGIIEGFEDYWMFDRRIVVPVRYNKENLWVGVGDPIRDLDKLAKYVKLRNELVKMAIPMEDFIRKNNVDLAPSAQKRSRSKSLIL